MSKNKTVDLSKQYVEPNQHGPKKIWKSPKYVYWTTPALPNLSSLTLTQLS